MDISKNSNQLGSRGFESSNVRVSFLSTHCFLGVWHISCKMFWLIFVQDRQVVKFSKIWNSKTGGNLIIMYLVP